MQYYLIVPFLFFLDLRWPLLGIPIHLLTISSFVYHILNPGTWGFDFVFARMWQFQLGTLSWQLTDKEVTKRRQVAPVKSENGYKLLATESPEDGLLLPEEESKPEPKTFTTYLKSGFYLLLSASFLLFLLPPIKHPWTQEGARIAGTVLSALFFACPGMGSVSLMTNRPLSFLGDISYVLYLIHWPVIIFLRSCYEITSYSYLEGLTLALILVLVSALIHYKIEKPLLKHVSASVLVILVSYTISAYLILSSRTIEVYTKEYWIDDPEKFWEFTIPKPTWSQKQKIENAIFVNQFYAKQRWLLPPFTGPYSDLFVTPRNDTPANTTLRVLNLGSSFTLRTTNIVEKVLRGKFKEMRLTTESGWEPFDLTSFTEFQEDYDLHMEELYKWKPDVIFLIQRFKYGFRQDPILGDLSEDNTTQTALEIMGKLENCTKKIVWGGMITDFNRGVASELSQRLSSGQSLDDFYEYPYSDFLEQQKNSIPRVKYVLERCKKCVWYDMQAPFCDEKKTKCRRFDKDTFLSYYGDHFHLCWSGNKVVEPSFSKLVADVVKEIGF
ncbi:hypothetical protein L596_010365 [Steinernema carpocapsae]|nr:hypothetical protein L596_010365 [Steinernema carpocapsae]